MEKVIVITGPTASGKTAVSIALSKRLSGEIINCDSMQIYKKCDIGSAKPTFEEQSGVTHHLIDIIDPKENFSTAEYKDKAIVCIKDILSRDKLPVITGGTGLYIDSLIKNIDFTIDTGNPELREKLNVAAEADGAECIYEKLKARDPKAALSVHPNNTRRVIRYLEILDGFEGTLEEYMKNTRKVIPEFDYKVFVLWPDREFVYGRIESRVEEMLESGLLEEVQSLMDNGIDDTAQCMMGIGYKETYSYLNGKMTYDEFVDLLKRNTRRYAKRQYTWFKRLEKANFIHTDAQSGVNDIIEIIVKAI